MVRRGDFSSSFRRFPSGAIVAVREARRAGLTYRLLGLALELPQKGFGLRIPRSTRALRLSRIAVSAVDLIFVQGSSILEPGTS